MQSVKNGAMTIGENMSQRTQSFYDANQMNHSQRVSEINDDAISRGSYLNVKR